MKIKVKDIPEKTIKRICSKYPVLLCIMGIIDCLFSGKDDTCFAYDTGFGDKYVELNGENIPTNREWMESLSDDELSSFLTIGIGIDDGYGTYVNIGDISRMFTKSQIGVEEWLSKPCKYLMEEEQ